MSEKEVSKNDIVWGCDIRTGKIINNKNKLIIDDNKIEETLEMVYSKLNDKEAFMLSCVLKSINKELLEAKK